MTMTDTPAPASSPRSTGSGTPSTTTYSALRSQRSGMDDGVSLPPQPSESEACIVRDCLELFYAARRHRRPMVKKWNDNYEVMCNRTWMAGRPSYLPNPEVPEIYPILASVVGWMTDQTPVLTSIPASELGSDTHEFFSAMAHCLAVVLRTNWEVYNYQGQVEQIVWDGFIYGTGIAKTCWDGALVSGKGDAKFVRTDPYTFYPDPIATDDTDGNYYIEARTMSVQEMDRRWPGSAAKVRPLTIEADRAPSELDRTTSGPPKANPGVIPRGGATNPSYGLPGQGRSTAKASVSDDPGITVLECWLRQHHRSTDPETKKATTVDEWRLVVVAGNRVLMDELASDLWGFDTHPYNRFVPHVNGQFWGFSMVEWLVPSQIQINKTLASLQHNIDLAGNPVFKEDARAGLSRTKIVNKPGQRVDINANGTAEWMNPPPLPREIMSLIEFYISEMERISGLTAIARGQAPGGRNAQGTIDSIQEASAIRIRLALRNLKACMMGVGEKLATLITENYTTPRLVFITGSENEAQAIALHAYHFYVPTDAGRMPMRFQIMIDVGSSQATSRQARIAEADALFAMGGIDLLALLQAHDYPDRWEIYKRVMAQQAAGVGAPGKREQAHH